jgi:hypothetical protein
MAHLLSIGEGEARHEPADELYHYLNFLELVAGLRDLKQISDQRSMISQS